MGLETIALINRDEARIGQEYGLVAECFDGLRDADGIQRRTESGFRKECDCLLRHGVPLRFLVFE
ncbi:hypothetical protein D3C72_2538190 [compost metagenome]